MAQIWDTQCLIQLKREFLALKKPGGVGVPKKGDSREGGGGTNEWHNICMRMNETILVKNPYMKKKSSIFE